MGLAGDRHRSRGLGGTDVCRRALASPCAAAEPVVWPDESEVDFGDSLADDEDDGESVEPDCPVVSAEATPHPKPMATPIPNAAAKPPIRPTCADAPMRRLISDRNRFQ